MISDKQLDILAFPYTDYKALICDGAIRSGKSSLMTVAYVDWAMREFRGRNFIFVGVTVSALVRNIIDPYLAMSYAKRRYKLRYLASKSVLIVERGNVRNQFYLFGADNTRSYEKIQGLTAAGCFVDEVALCNEETVNQALARCSVDGSKFWFNCNPASPMHWFYTDWILQAEQKRALHLHFQLRDNPSLSEETIRDYETRYTGVFKRRYIDGEWVQAEGLVYPFERERFECDEALIGQITRKPTKGSPNDDYIPGRWHVSIDYGISNPFAALLWYVTKGRAYCVDEYYYDGRKRPQLTDAEHYANVCKLIGDRQVEAIVIDPSATSFKVEVNRVGRHYIENADNDVLNGIAVTGKYLADGHVKVSGRCTNLMTEIGLYSWDDKASKDAVIKENDHAMDAMRYEAYTMLIDDFM